LQASQRKVGELLERLNERSPKKRRSGWDISFVVFTGVDWICLPVWAIYIIRVSCTCECMSWRCAFWGQKSRRVRNGKKSQNAFEDVYIRADRVTMELHVAEPHI
jgi:hypothetical protein